MDVLIEESPAEWVREIFVEKFRNTTTQTLSDYGFISDVGVSSTLRILDRLPTTDWLSNDEWHSAGAIDFLRGLSSDPRRSLSDEDRECLGRVLDKLPQPAEKEDESVDSAVESMDDAIRE